MLFRMFTPRPNLIPPQTQRPIPPPQPRVHTARITQLRACLTPPPHARPMCVAVRTFWRSRRHAGVRVKALVLIATLVRCDERRWSHLVALLEVEPARIAQGTACGGIASPEGRGGRGAVRARFAGAGGDGGGDAALPGT